MRRKRIKAWWVAAALLLVAVTLAGVRRTAWVRGVQAVPWDHPLVERDLDTIVADTLRVLTIRDPLSWEERPGAEAGLEYELLRRFVRGLDIVVVALPMDHPDSMVKALQEGRGDVIAAQLVPRGILRKRVALTAPYRTVRPVLARLRPDPQGDLVLGAKAAADEPDSAVISPWSPFADKAYRYEHPPAKRIVLHDDPYLTPEDLLMEVVMGRHDATVVTDARAAHEAGRFPVLETGAPLGPELPLSFAVRRNAPMLLKALNAWIADPAEDEARGHLFGAYAKPVPKPGPLRVRKRVPVEGDSVSPYDAWFQEHAGRMPWDWQLLAAMAYRESRFDSTVVSRMGAQGIMQIMPRTAARLGLDTSHVMDDHIAAAVRYLNKLDTMWMRAIPDRERRLRFVLASYNAGPGHIIDAQRLAQQLGLDPGRWEHHVERAALLLAKPRYHMLPEMKNGYCNGTQVFHYVRDVTDMYTRLKAGTKGMDARR